MCKGLSNSSPRVQIPLPGHFEVSSERCSEADRWFWKIGYNPWCLLDLKENYLVRDCIENGN